MSVSGMGGFIRAIVRTAERVSVPIRRRRSTHSAQPGPALVVGRGLARRRPRSVWHRLLIWAIATAIVVPLGWALGIVP